MSCFTCFATEFVRVDDFVVLTGDTQPFTFILAQFQVDIPGAFFEVFKVSMQRKCISVRIDCSKDYSNCSVSFEVL